MPLLYSQGYIQDLGHRWITCNYFLYIFYEMVRTVKRWFYGKKHKMDLIVIYNYICLDNGTV